jgi:hypothetical protein
VWKDLDGVPLLTDPFERLEQLYEIHWSVPKLAEECALGEGLATTGREALKRAYAYGDGTYTQSALAAQTLNRAYTLVSLCECACLVASGEQVPGALDAQSGRRGPIIRSLAERPHPHLLGPFVFELLCGWGGFWPLGVEQPFKETIASTIGAGPAQVDDLLGFINSLFRSAGMGNFVKEVEYRGVKWRNMLLLPYFAKGIGVRRIESEARQEITWAPWVDWKDDSLRLEA